MWQTVLGKKFRLYFTSPDIDRETKYNIGVGVPAEKEFANFSDTAVSEPNNHDEQAVMLPIEKTYYQYVYWGDLDVFTIEVAKKSCATSSCTTFEKALYIE